MFEHRIAAVLAGLMAICTAVGCGAGGKFRYHGYDLELKAQGDGPLGLAVHDQREYIRSDEKVRAYVGDVRKAGVPYDALTTSGNPLATDIQGVLAKALSKRGFKVEQVEVAPHFKELDVVKLLVATGAERSVLVAIREWMADVRSENIELSFDLRLAVINKHRSIVAEVEHKGTDKLSGRPEIALGQAYRAKLEGLLNDPKIVEALGAGQAKETP